jgi:molybdopterin-guanine dinucleotide biosynthesis protein A
MGMRIAAIILAGGEGRRIGGDKPLRLLGNRTLVDRAIVYARTVTGDIALSVGAEDRLPRDAMPHLVDADPDWGPLAGLAAGLVFAAERQCDLLLTIPCDSPFLPDDLAARLAAALEPEHGAAIPASGGRLHMACGLWRSGVRAQLADYAAAGRRSLHGLAEVAGFSRVDWPAQSVDFFFNINSPDQLAAAEAMFRDAGRDLPCA